MAVSACLLAESFSALLLMHAKGWGLNWWFDWAVLVHCGILVSQEPRTMNRGGKLTRSKTGNGPLSWAGMDENWIAKSVKVELLSGTCALKDKEEIDVLHQNGDFHARKTAAGERKGQTLKSARSRIGAFNKFNNWQTLAKQKRRNPKCACWTERRREREESIRNRLQNFNSVLTPGKWTSR